MTTITSKVKDILNSPFPYFLNDEKKNAFMTFAVSIFVILMMISFNPLARACMDKTFLIALLTFLVLFPAVIVTPRLFPAAFDLTGWTFGKHLLFTAIVLMATGIVITTGLYFAGYYPEFTYPQTLVHIYPDVFTYGMVPITIVTLLTKNLLLKENLESALRANQELGRISAMKGKDENIADNILTIHSDTTETLSLNLPELLFVEASDNYSTFYWKKGAATEKKMLRMNLKSVENQLNNSFALRCHRSFLVNVYSIDAITGNTNGYKLTITNSNFSIPVSRSKGKEVIERIGQIRSMMEIGGN